jgi:exosortase/archaeosortase family protein
MTAPARRLVPDRAALRFGLAAIGWTVGLFALLRAPAVQQHVLLPLTQLQGRVAAGTAAPLPVLVTLECSGADVIALCLAATLAFPAPWRRRVLGALGGLALILVLNTLRIATLARASGTRWFVPLHETVWPGLLVLATLAYVATWMWRGGASGDTHARMPAARRFALLAAALVTVFVAVSPALNASAGMRAAGARVAGVAAALLSVLGASARANGTVIVTGNGAFVVTPECITTPLMPLYLAAVLALPSAWGARVAGLLAFAPLFGALTVARLFTLALPPFLARSPMFPVHAFYQVLLGALLVAAAVWWRHGRHRRGRAVALAAAAIGVGAGFAAVTGAAYAGLLRAEGVLLRAWAPRTLVSLTWPGDQQGALLLMPAYQLGLFVALWLAAFGARRLRAAAAGLLALHASHVLVLVALGMTGGAAGVPPTPLRAWAVAGPLALAWLLRPRAAGVPPPPALAAAASA